MKFITAFRAAHALLIVLGLFALWVADFLPLSILLMAIVGFLVSEAERVRRVADLFPVLVLNALTLAVFVYMVAVYFLGKDDLVAAVVYFTVFLQFVRMFTARTNRDYFQIYILSISHLVLSTLLTSDLLFVVPFLLFIVSAPWCLTLYNLKAQAEEAFMGVPEKGKVQDTASNARLTELLNSRRAVTGGFFWSTSILSVLLLANTAVIFLTFPRVSRGFLMRNTRYGHNASGFSDNVDLKSFGLIKQNHQIVMRVRSKSKDALDASGLFWRGLCYDHYDGISWSRSKVTARRLPLTRTYGAIPIRSRSTDGLLEHEVILDRLDSDVFFALHRVDYVKWDRAYVERAFRRKRDNSPAGPALAVDEYGGLHFDGGLEYERHYRAFSRIQVPWPKTLRAASREAQPDSPEKRMYLQLPEMSARFHALAKTITQNRDNDYDRVADVVAHLKTNYRYTLKVPRHDGNPVEGFLFENKEGHCEFFATTAVLLLRAAGVPARLVSGFRGGDWNDYGDFLAVRHRDAHTWIEVFFDGHGWLPFDPTAPDASAEDYKDIHFLGWTHLLESLELKWHGYVVNFELRDQEKMVGGMANAALSAMTRYTNLVSGESFRSFIDRLRKSQRPGGTGATLWRPEGFIGMALFVGAALVVWIVRRRIRRSPRRVLSRACSRFLALAAKHGFTRHPGETLRELNHRIAQQHPALAAELGAFVDVYYEARFSLQDMRPDEDATLAALLDAVQVAWRDLADGRKVA